MGGVSSGGTGHQTRTRPSCSGSPASRATPAGYDVSDDLHRAREAPMGATRTTTRLLQNYVGGTWTTPGDVATQEVRNPATDEVLAHVPLSGTSEVDAAVQAAAAAFPARRWTPP